MTIFPEPIFRGGLKQVNTTEGGKMMPDFELPLFLGLTLGAAAILGWIAYGIIHLGSWIFG